MRRNFVTVLATAVIFALPAASNAQNRPATAATTAEQLIGSWNGTASIPLGDSTVNVPIVYTFTSANGSISGTATVPGMGTGKISNIVPNGSRISFRLTVPASIAASAGATGQGDRQLDHEGTLSADGTIDGMINYDAKPVAKFRIKRVVSSR